MGLRFVSNLSQNFVVYSSGWKIMVTEWIGAAAAIAGNEIGWGSVE